jgi:hypothetical protein
MSLPRLILGRLCISDTKLNGFFSAQGLFAGNKAHVSCGSDTRAEFVWIFR